MNAAQPGNLKNVRICAAEWLERREHAGWTDADAAELDAWLAADPAHAVAFWRVEVAWQRTERLAALRSPMRSVESPHRAIWLIFGKSAAAIVFAGLVGGGLYVGTLDPGQQVYATGVGARKTLSLPDGSHIELNTGTVLRLSKRDNRHAWLDKGEAYFQVVHDPRHPFVVDVGMRRITDVGTKFVVRHENVRFKVDVLEGAVNLAAKSDNAQSLLLVRGDSAVANGNALTVKSRPIQGTSDELGWRRGVLIFDNVTLAEAAAEFNRYNTDKIVIADAKVAGLRVVGTFPTNGVDGFIDVAKHILKVHVQKRGSQVVISH